MTLHAAKGLEFEAVVLTGLEERIFPSSRALADPDAIAEERRLCYVGITRAKRRLHLTLARQRALFGELAMNAPSRFLEELPREHVDGLESVSRPRMGFGGSPSFQPPVSRPAPAPRTGTWIERDEPESWDDDAPRRPPPRLVPVNRPPTPAPPASEPAGSIGTGRRVRHATFGEGRVLSVQGAGPQAKLTVSFPVVGPKVVVARFLELLD
jgi:DNA helicase-2/ATP-dependent DNA helicase PcrA